MESKELRIGNYIQWGDNKNKIEIVNLVGSGVLGLKSDAIFDIYTPIESFKPIVLTNDWLVRFGYEKSNDGYFYHNPSPTIPIYYRNEGNVGLCFYGLSNEIRYVHQLQNLFFALTGKELTLNK